MTIDTILQNRKSTYEIFAGNLMTKQRVCSRCEWRVDIKIENHVRAASHIYHEKCYQEKAKVHPNEVNPNDR